ncbi:PRC-barrel domain-containing protein [Paenibacillus antarcticus]|uniref:Photosystem reaction center subunit H n=1 Tax=Paenibacillus antarcticus TaxID=253703 RepID=A0A162PZG4_9BACL|nr:PRC-barrel domain-containing protein [Paenibacillus antarcticus]OAB40740.1 photosystem reaction center subunit H [Paenibacillus antarcticus]
MKLQEMIGISVYDVEEGKEIGKVCDFILDAHWTIVSFELERKALFSKMVNTIDWSDIVAYGEDAVMIRNQQAVRKTKADNIQLTYSLGKKKLKDLPVITEDGLTLGRISDVYIDQEVGNTIVGLEISDGFVTDIIEGRKWLPCTSDMVVGEDAVIVPPMSEERLVQPFILEADR